MSVAGLAVTTQLAPEEQVDWRVRGSELLRLLAQRGTGLVITVDKIHAADRTELSQRAADVQHFIRDGLPIGLIFAGLPAAVSDLLNEGVATFLRGADRLCGGWVDSSFFNHPAQNAFVDFNGVLVRKNLGNENALPAF